VPVIPKKKGEPLFLSTPRSAPNVFEELWKHAQEQAENSAAFRTEILGQFPEPDPDPRRDDVSRKPPRLPYDEKGETKTPGTPSSWRPLTQHVQRNVAQNPTFHDVSRVTQGADRVGHAVDGTNFVSSHQTLNPEQYLSLELLDVEESWDPIAEFDFVKPYDPDMPWLPGEGESEHQVFVGTRTGRMSGSGPNFNNVPRGMQVTSQRFVKEEVELQAMKMPLTKIIEENSVQDMQALLNAYQAGVIGSPPAAEALKVNVQKTRARPPNGIGNLSWLPPVKHLMELAQDIRPVHATARFVESESAAYVYDANAGGPITNGSMGHNGGGPGRWLKMVSNETAQAQMNPGSYQSYRDMDSADAMAYALSGSKPAKATQQAKPGLFTNIMDGTAVLGMDPAEHSVISKAESIIVKGGGSKPGGVLWEVPAGKRWEIHELTLTTDKNMWAELHRAPVLQRAALCSIQLQAHQSITQRWADPICLTGGDILSLVLYNPNPGAANTTFKILVKERDLTAREFNDLVQSTKK
jgi:hypothetical protein